MDETTFKRSEADLDQAAGTVDKETYMRNGVEMAKVEYSTLFQDKKKKTKRLQESVSSDRIRPQPPSEKLEETKSLELMDNVDAYDNDGWCSDRRDMIMMRDSIPELLALPELKHPIGSEPKPKEPLDGSHASPLSQQVDTQVYSPNSTQHIEKEPSNQTHAAQTQFFSTNVTQQLASETPINGKGVVIFKYPSDPTVVWFTFLLPFSLHAS
ncbi:hypothetical protein F2Q69_00027666 [Brassica cretica]|uniref:Uncharacterized protein n=1 Tax=Brassica cretica TaxID=69181 RepID=A0A8S9S6B1_BRACR|nr:hypothetical protein F2Q69_00027666 [Brassica cretica]